MLLREIISRTGLSKDTIRFYEKTKLIQLNRHDRRENNYREYTNDHLEKLLTVKRLKNFGFTLNEIGEVLEMIDKSEASCENLSDKLAEKVAVLDQKIIELYEIRNKLITGAKLCDIGCNTDQSKDLNCPVITTDYEKGLVPFNPI